MTEYNISQIVTPSGDICNLKDNRIEGISNNLTTTVQNKVLDARQGKALKDLIDGITPTSIGAKALQIAVTDPEASGTSITFIDTIAQNTQGVILPTKKTVSTVSQSAAGLMSASDKIKLDGIATGAQVNSITGVKGNAESSYRTGNVNLTAANVGAVAKSGDTMTGKLTFTTTNAIAYTGSKATYDMIKFIDNTNDVNGNGIYIGGGGATIIGGGESAIAAMAQVSGGDEILYLCNDSGVNVFTNLQNGWDSRKAFSFGANGTLTAPAFSGPLTGNVTGNCSGSAGSCSSENLTNIALNWSGSYSTGSWMLIYNGETGTNGGALFKAINRANTAAWVDNEHKWARIGGDTFTGRVTASYAGESYFKALNTNTSVAIHLDSDADGTHGIWSSGYWNGSSYTNSGKWLIYRHQNGTVTVNGNCTGTAAAATKATQDGNGNTISSTYLKLSGGTINDGGQITASTCENDSAYNGGIQLREYKRQTTTCGTTLYYAPGITFHWAGRYAYKLALGSDGVLYFGSKKVATGNFGSKVTTFSSGKATVSFSDFGVSSRPPVLVLTPQSAVVTMLYNYDYSSSNILLEAWNRDGTGYSGSLRYGYICIP